MVLKVDQEKVWIRELSALICDNVIGDHNQSTEDIIHGVIRTFLSSKGLIFYRSTSKTPDDESGRITTVSVPFKTPNTETSILPSIATKEMNFLGTWKTADGRTAIVVSKSKYVVPQTRKEQVIWIGFITTSILDADGVRNITNGPIPMFWLENGKNFYSHNNEDLVEAVRVKV